MNNGASSFEMQTVAAGSSRTLILTGEVDLLTAPDIESAIRELCAGGTGEIVLDLRKVTFMDSTGLRATVSAQKLCDEHGFGFSLIKGQAQVQRLFEIAGLDTRFQWQTVRPAKTYIYREGQRPRLRA
jgi:anti-sigma B factor antagonist